MTAYEIIRIEQELKVFAARNFEKPSVCRNSDQIRFYSTELCVKIEEYESKYNYVPAWAYVLLEEYHMKQNLLVENLHLVISH